MKTGRIRRRSGGRGVLSPSALLGLGAGTAVAFALLFPLEERRERDARRVAPDLVSLSYLKLNLERQPDDPVLRRALGERLLQAGAFDEADAVCAPLLRDGGELSARELSVEIAFQHWMSLGVRDVSGRASWREHTVQRLKTVLGAELEPGSAEGMAQISVALGERELGADFLDRLARSDLRLVRVQHADAAYLAARAPLGAARLWAALALANESAPEAPDYARLALERARSADRPRDGLALFTRLRPHFATNAEFLELGLQIAGGLDDRLALGIARELQVLRPEDSSLAERIAKLTAWTAPPALPPRPAPPPTRAQQIADARAHWDLARVLSLTDDAPHEPSELEDRIALLEATGRVSEALGVLDQALGTDLGNDPKLWGRELALQLAAGQIESSLATLDQIQRRFGLGRQEAYRKADLLIALGRQREALALLVALPLDGDSEHARKLTRVAWELGDMDQARLALGVLVQSKDAQAWDFERLWQIDYEARDYRAALGTAEQGYERFATPALLQLAIDAALAAHDEKQTLALLERADSSESSLRRDPAFWSLRAQLYQERTRQALGRGQLDVARQSSSEARAVLERAGAIAPDGPGGYSALWAAQRRQALSLALDGNDAKSLAVLYAEQAPTLRPRERVAVLSRLGEYEQAADLAVDALAVDATAAHVEESPAERDGLAADARSLTESLPRQLWLHSAAQSLPQLFSLTLGGGAEYAFSRGMRLRAAADVTRFSGFSGATPGPTVNSLPWSSDADAAIEAAGQITGQLDGSELTVGMAARPDAVVQPFLDFEQKLLEREGTELRLGVRINDRTSETARLRLFGAEDQLALIANVGIGEHAYLSASAAGQAYWEHDRTYLGSGATINAGAGYNVPLGSELGTANFRASTYIAPRVAEDRSQGFIPEGTTWLGIGSSLTRGRLDVPPVFGRQISFLTDATLGWLIPQQELGWSGRAGLGISLLGADLLSVSASASNVLGTAPGFAAYTLSAEYRMSEWK